MDTNNLPQEEHTNKAPKNNSKNLFSFEGRIRRRSYWIQYFICSMIMGILSAATENGFDEGGGQGHKTQGNRYPQRQHHIYHF